jgi:hypothetical protein
MKISVNELAESDLSRCVFRAGSQVIVRSPEEILATLDANGALDGLPFMPEMLACCGKPFRVHRRVEKTCMEVDPPVPPHRLFEKNDVVTLDGLRCDGNGHDGCSRGCRIYWKEAWLRKREGADTTTRISEAALKVLHSHLKVRADGEHYFCQSTELFRATVPYRGRRKPWMLSVAIREIRNGDRSLLELARLFIRWCGLKLYRLVNRDERLRGPNKGGTPIASLDLKPGERVRVKTFDQVVATLDYRRRNRGMVVCHEMTRCCGEEAEVRARVDRIIEEKTGKMREMQHTVTLKNLRGNPTLCDECLCYNEIGDCPRGDLMYWREIWLERVNDTRS